MANNKEIEIKVKIETDDVLRDLLETHGEFLGEEHQIDEYFTLSDRDFTAIRPVAEWLRLRDSDGKYSINYKKWNFNSDGKASFCDEFETPVENLDQLRNILRVLGFKSLVVVDKTRRTWILGDWEISIDDVKNLGNSVEIEYKGTEDVDPDSTTEEMIAFLQKNNCGTIQRNYQGYPFMLLFPDETKYEEV